MTEEGFDNVSKWLARKDTNEASRALLKDGGSFVSAGQDLKILDTGLMKSKVRIISTDRECWIVREATDR